jgi:hypothetical protein
MFGVDAILTIVVCTTLFRKDILKETACCMHSESKEKQGNVLVAP